MSATASSSNPASRRFASARREALALVASMRFAITLLCVICIASVIGTVVKQGEPLPDYVNKFGPFWAELFGHFSLFTVYSAPWFLLILAFLVTSTSLCIARNAPKILADLRSFKEGVREQSLRAFHHKAEGHITLQGQAALDHASAVLARHGWQAKAQVRPDGTMVAARKGRVNKLGYLAAHSAIVLICLGGLFDGDLVVKTQMALTGKSSFEGGGLIRDVPAEHRLPAGNPTFRGNLMVPEGARSGTAILQMPDGIVLQDLDFDVELKRFMVEYYETGMPRLFASQIVLHDHDGSPPVEATVKVNEPVTHHGVAIYQSSFEDGGSTLKLKALPLQTGGQPFEINTRVGDNLPLQQGRSPLTLEITGLRVINVENLGAGDGAATDVRKVDLGSTLQKHLGSGVSPDKAKQLRNVGPSISYKLRDASGQAREFNNYMVPIELDGQRVFVVGVRDTPADNFRYLRLPVDEQGSLDGWLRLRHALGDPALREQAASRYAKQAAPTDKPEMIEQLHLTSARALALFAGVEPAAKKDTPNSQPSAGLVALSQFIDASVPQPERARVADVLLRILSSALNELNDIAREQAGLKPLAGDAAAQAFMNQAVISLSDSFFYPAPVLLELQDFQQRQASVFQVARAPGKTLVYLGAILLIIGVFAMLYVRERRLWIWLHASPTEPSGSRMLMALSTPRRTLDVDEEFAALRHDLIGDPVAAEPAVTGDTP